MASDIASNGHDGSSSSLDDETISRLDKQNISDSTEEADSASETVQHAIEMQKRCRLLLEELEEFSEYLRRQKRENAVECRTFKGGLQSEMKLLDKLVKADPTNPKTTHAIRSSNLAFFSAVWSTAKTCTSVVSLGKRFYWAPGVNQASLSSNKFNKAVDRNKKSTNGALVDIVAQDGLEWIKVSSVTEKRIIWDLAKAGWVGSSDDESEDGNQVSDDEDESQGLLKQAEMLVRASKAARIKYRHPVIRLVLPRISSQPESKEVRKVLQQIRDLGVIIQTSDQIPETSIPLGDVLHKIAAQPHDSFTDTLNIDCTILLAFVSDLSHGRVLPEHWHNKAISRQIEMEAEDQLLPNSLWPICGDKKMVCTRAAAVRMQEIVEIIGTETEKKRTDLIINANDLSKHELVIEFQKLSSYKIPPEWALPIEIVDVDLKTTLAKLPHGAAKVSEVLTPINQSVFLYGWVTGLTTISSNGIVAKEIESTIEENRVDDEMSGPEIWLSPSSRSLVGKEKQRRGFTGLGMARNQNVAET